MIKHAEEKMIETFWFNDIEKFDDIIKKITKVYETQTHGFKINVSFGYVFETIAKIPDNSDFIDYSIGFGCDDKTLLDEPMYIGDKKDFQKLISKINSVDEEFFNQSNNIKNSKTKAIGIYQLFVKLYNTENPIGTNVFLPDIILNSKFIYSALNIVTKEDNTLCFWRCLAKHQNQDIKNEKLIKISKILFFYKYYGNNKQIKDYLGL